MTDYARTYKVVFHRKGVRFTTHVMARDEADAARKVRKAEGVKYEGHLGFTTWNVSRVEGAQ